MTSRRSGVRSLVLVGFCVCGLATSALAQDCPELLGQWPDNPAELVTIDEPYAYAAYDTLLMVADISDPEAPEVVGSVDLTHIGGLAAANGYIFVGGDDFVVVDATDPEQPHVVATVDLTGAEQIAISGTFAYVSVFYPPALRVYDISVPSSPTEVGFLPDIFGIASIEVVGPYAYVPWYDTFGTPPGGLKIVDVSTPSAPFVAGSVDFSDDYVGRAAVHNGYAYIATLDGFRVVDVRAPTAPVEVGTVAMPCYWPNGIVVNGSYAWVACWEAGLRVLELSDPESPVEVGSYDPPEFLAFVDVGNELAAAANSEAGLLVFDTCELPVFADGFESGDTSAWSTTVP
ncbi:MAG TPA: hypothetical protein PKJ99_12960 [Thermoanaerobaculales bacterium]|nr:hypothetical protein [Thermoanaerobaculales bacterium]